MALYDSKAAGKRIAKLRNDRSLIQEELAERIGVSSKHIGRIERGECNPSPETYVKLVRFFNVSMDYIFFGTPDAPLYEINKIMEKSSKKKQKMILSFLRWLDEFED